MLMLGVYVAIEINVFTQVSTLASMQESTLTLSVNWSLQEPQKLNTPHGQTVTRVFTLPMIKRTLSFYKLNFNKFLYADKSFRATHWLFL